MAATTSLLLAGCVARDAPNRQQALQVEVESPQVWWPEMSVCRGYPGSNVADPSYPPKAGEACPEPNLRAKNLW